MSADLPEDAPDLDEYEAGERLRLEQRDAVPDEELIARTNPAPDMGGALLAELFSRGETGKAVAGERHVPICRSTPQKRRTF
jgi:hypothetical protein